MEQRDASGSYKPIQDLGDGDAPLWPNWVVPAKCDGLTDGQGWTTEMHPYLIKNSSFNTLSWDIILIREQCKTSRKK